MKTSFEELLKSSTNTSRGIENSATSNLHDSSFALFVVFVVRLLRFVARFIIFSPFKSSKAFSFLFALQFIVYTVYTICSCEGGCIGEFGFWVGFDFEVVVVM